MAEFPSNIHEEEDSGNSSRSDRGSTETNEPIFFGLEAIDRALNNIYPAEGPILISAPVKKIWCGGNYPLDFVKIFFCKGYEDCISPAHWHYITCGFSDLHGDGRVHEFFGRGYRSGFGFELTFRVAKRKESKPPLWPVHILNILSDYIFETGQLLGEFHHIAWHVPLEQTKGEESTDSSEAEPMENQSASSMRHLIVVEDPKIPFLDTPNGTVVFFELVGIMKDEYRYARAYQGCSIAQQLLDHPQVGPLMITDVQRDMSIFDCNPRFRAIAKNNIDTVGMFLEAVSANVLWEEECNEQSNQEGQASATTAAPFGPVKTFHLFFDAPAAELLSLIIRGRLLRNRSFKFNCSRSLPRNQRYSIKFIPGGLSQDEGPNADESNLMLAEHDEENYLCVICPTGMIKLMLDRFAYLENITDAQEGLPKVFVFFRPGRTIHFHIVREHHPLGR